MHRRIDRDDSNVSRRKKISHHEEHPNGSRQDKKELKGGYRTDKDGEFCTSESEKKVVCRKTSLEGE